MCDMLHNSYRNGDSRWEGKKGRLPQNDMANDTGRVTRNVPGRQARNEMANVRGDA